MKRGRPAFYTSAERLQRKIDAYFKNCPDFVELTAFDKNNGNFVTYKKYTPTISGLVLFLGFSDRKMCIRKKRHILGHLRDHGGVYGNKGVSECLNRLLFSEAAVMQRGGTSTHHQF